MTEYELAELISIISSNLLTNITVILTIVSFYIIAAYAVGDKFPISAPGASRSVSSASH